MRNLLIALVLLFTGLTFYSALWFKSETIENDITARVTDELAASDAKNIAVDVDGRHVTLTGIVHDEAQEAAYLDTADTTYGALGPIDGLTYLADGGYVSAVKTADGITLRGTVPNEDARAALIANASAATDGAVDDQLTVSGPTAEWQEEATLGVSQLAGLTTGTLTAAAGAYALSGSTDADPADITGALADRDGWQTYVSSPTAAQSMSDDVARLTGDVADRDVTISDLETSLADGKAQIGTLTEERDTVSTELDTLRASLTEGQANSADLRNQLTAAQAQITANAEDITLKDQVIDANGTMIAGLNAQVSSLGNDVSNLRASLESTTAELGAANQTIADLTGDVSDRDATIAELRAGAEDVVSSANAGDDAAAALRVDLSERDATIADLTAKVGDAEGALAESTDQVASLNADIAAMTSEMDGNATEIARLNAALDSADASDATDQLAVLNDDLAQKDAQIATLSTNVDEGAAEVARLNEELANRDGTLADTASQVAALTAATQANDAATATLEGQVTDLTAVVAERDATIASLQNVTPVSGSNAEQCAAQASSALEGSRINFDTSTATINGDSVALLERLTGIALACVGEGLTVEIGGHTDAQGSDENNQVLSEARAQAVVDFMVARGVPADGLQATGYGESEPVASNDTSEGRAQNRRISFDWQAR